MNGYWFIPVYLGLFILSPILNSFIETSSLKKLKWYIIIFYIFFTIDAFPYSSQYSNSGYSIYSFCGLYLIGAFLKKGNIVNHKWFSSKRLISIYLIAITAVIAISTILISTHFQKSGSALQLFPLSPIAYNNPLVIIQSILIFILFLKIKIQSNLVNWCASSALAIYLFHMHPAIKQDYYTLSNYFYQLSFLNQYLSILLLIITVAIIAIPVDKIREWLFDCLYISIKGLGDKLKRHKS